jgi:hypothetical protein
MRRGKMPILIERNTSSLVDLSLLNGDVNHDMVIKKREKKSLAVRVSACGGAASQGPFMD